MRKLFEIAADIRADWRPIKNGAARSALEQMVRGDLSANSTTSTEMALALWASFSVTPRGGVDQSLAA
jgi:hypothetical protein